MKILIYSDKCEYCKKLLTFLNKNNGLNYLKLLNADTNKIPPNISMVPSLFDTELSELLEGKKVFEYITIDII